MTSKRTARTALKFSAAAALALQGSSAFAAPKEAGLWYDDSGKGAVKIEVCGDKLCGRIYWLKETLNAEGKPLRDKHNPNESQQNRPICGLQVIGGLALMQDGEWDSGWIYDPKEGKSYSVALKLADDNTLKVTGYLVMKMMGRTLTWTRAPSDLPSCSGNSAAAPQATPASAKSAPKPTPAPSKVAAPLPEEQAQAEPTTPEPEVEAPAAKPAAPAPKAPSAKPAATAGAPAKPAKAPAKAAVTPTATETAAPVDPAAKAGASKTAAKKSAASEAAAPTTSGKSEKKASAGTKTAAKTKGAEQLPWTAKKEAPAAGAAPAAEAINPEPVAIKKERPALSDDQARPFQ